MGNPAPLFTNPKSMAKTWVGNLFKKKAGGTRVGNLIRDFVRAETFGIVDNWW